MEEEDPKKFEIKNFKIVGDFIIEIHFVDGKEQTINFGEIDHKGWWEPLNDLEYFNKVKINEIQNLDWPDGQDFMPRNLYYWEIYGKYYPQKDGSQSRWEQ